MNLTELATVIKSVIETTPYYNNLAKESEIAKYSEVNLSKLLENNSYYISTTWIDDKIAGFSISVYDDCILWIHWVGVSDWARRKGVAKRLLADLEHIAISKGCHKIWTDSLTCNTEASNLLLKSNYNVITSLSKHWYGQDFFLWEKFL